MPGAMRDWILPPGPLDCHVFFFLLEEEALHVPNHSNTSRQIKETSRSVGYTAPGGKLQASDIYGPTRKPNGPSLPRGQNPIMHGTRHGRDKSKPRVRGGLSPAAGSRG